MPLHAELFGVCDGGGESSRRVCGRVARVEADWPVSSVGRLWARSGAAETVRGEVIKAGPFALRLRLLKFHG